VVIKVSTWGEYADRKFKELKSLSRLFMFRFLQFNQIELPSTEYVQEMTDVLLDDKTPWLTGRLVEFLERKTFQTDYSS
jgi:hypothetical protein